MQRTIMHEKREDSHVWPIVGIQNIIIEQITLRIKLHMATLKRILCLDQDKNIHNIFKLFLT